ncbi:hypothetical protein [Novosphingobium sp.]|uniref:hypothetical protein n=1 Tax=Novosphingobium sp. TaxID=1874826 RepID=UPI0025FDE3FD|nr:hypothetical protein [Novosphingobium sp.]MCC6925009.1 hypothetical protein [Novosphingobium sp.]
MNAQESDARLRFFILSAVRLASVALIAVGMAIVAGKLPIPKPAGVVFMVFGLLELLLLPPFLARKWKSPQP